MWLGLQHTRENVTQVSDIKFVVEINGSLSKFGGHLFVERNGSLDQSSTGVEDFWFEVREMASQESFINNDQGIVLWEGDG